MGLSATLPNYVDVARFLAVNPYQGLFYFDAGFRPVPLSQNFVGVKGRAGSASSQAFMNHVCYEKVLIYSTLRGRVADIQLKLHETGIAQGEGQPSSNGLCAFQKGHSQNGLYAT